MVRQEFCDPYVMIQGKAEIHEDLETKKKYGSSVMEPYFQNPENPDSVVIRFKPNNITTTTGTGCMERVIFFLLFLFSYA